MDRQGIIKLLLMLADDALIYGHRTSEWTGLAPTLEDDIALSSIAQDKIGHAFQLYTIIHENLGGQNPDQIAFFRPNNEMLNCQLAELETEDYSIALVRHFFMDIAEKVRYNALRESSFGPLANLAKKIAGEVKYHTLHATTWMKVLGQASAGEAKDRMQRAIDSLWPYALGIFELTDNDANLAAENLCPSQNELQSAWLKEIKKVLDTTSLTIGSSNNEANGKGGRYGNHTDSFTTLMEEMKEVIASDVGDEW